MASSAGRSASARTPPFCGSSPTLTWTSTSTGRPRAAARARQRLAPAAGDRPSGSGRSSSRASLTLLVCRWPIRCHGRGRPSTRDLLPRLLHAVLAERGHARRDRGPDALDVDRLGHRHQEHGVLAASGPAGRVGDALLHGARFARMSVSKHARRYCSGFARPRHAA